MIHFAKYGQNEQNMSFGRSLDSQCIILTHTVDGINPAPPWMVETL